MKEDNTAIGTTYVIGTTPTTERCCCLRFALEERQGKWGFLPERWEFDMPRSGVGGQRARGYRYGLPERARRAWESRGRGKGCGAARRAYRRLWAITAVHHARTREGREKKRGGGACMVVGVSLVVGKCKR
jgi:hypothetical protein